MAKDGPDIPTASIWVVDDDPSVGRALHRMVQSLGVDCVLFSSGADLLMRIDTSRPTFLLLDIHMPQTSGIEALRALRARGIDTPAVMMTGVERDSTRESCLAAGASDVLAKPVDIGTILALIHRFRGTQPESPDA
jgi:two-component system catabolic regulation response regulator CreB